MGAVWRGVFEGEVYGVGDGELNGGELCTE